jgi:hypothetical protein
VQACDWIADCPIEGCSSQCKVSSQVGNMIVPLTDTAWDLDWWQVCPELALRTWRARRSSLESQAPAPSGVVPLPPVVPCIALPHNSISIWTPQYASRIHQPSALPVPQSLLQRTAAAWLFRRSAFVAVAWRKSARHPCSHQKCLALCSIKWLVLKLYGRGQYRIIASFPFQVHDNMCAGDALPLFVHLMAPALVLLACCFADSCILFDLNCDESLMFSFSSLTCCRPSGMDRVLLYLVLTLKMRKRR